MKKIFLTLLILNQSLFAMMPSDRLDDDGFQVIMNDSSSSIPMEDSVKVTCFKQPSLPNKAIAVPPIPDTAPVAQIQSNLCVDDDQPLPDQTENSDGILQSCMQRSFILCDAKGYEYDYLFGFNNFIRILRCESSSLESLQNIMNEKRNVQMFLMGAQEDGNDKILSEVLVKRGFTLTFLTYIAKHNLFSFVSSNLLTELMHNLRDDEFRPFVLSLIDKKYFNALTEIFAHEQVREILLTHCKGTLATMMLQLADQGEAKILASLLKHKDLKRIFLCGFNGQYAQMAIKTAKEKMHIDVITVIHTAQEGE